MGFSDSQLLSMGFTPDRTPGSGQIPPHYKKNRGNNRGMGGRGGAF